MAQNDTVVDLNEVGSDQLQFQDIAHDDMPEEPPGAKVQTHTFTDFPEPADESDEDSQQADLLKDEKKPASFWTFEYYQGYFDVDTHQVLRRILGSVLPNPKLNYLERQIRPNPDLYGPFWICITLVFTTAIAGNMANYFQMSGKDYLWQYDFHKVTFAASAIFGYWWVMPALLYALLWWRRSQAGYTFTEILCVYGYSLAIYIPISILWVIQISWLQWLLVMVGMVLSGSVLVLTFWPAISQDDKKVALLSMGMIILFHGLLAIGFVLYFFHVPPQMAPTVVTTTPANVVQNTTTAAAMLNPGLPPSESKTGDEVLAPGHIQAGNLLAAPDKNAEPDSNAQPDNIAKPDKNTQGDEPVAPPSANQVEKDSEATENTDNNAEGGQQKSSLNAQTHVTENSQQLGEKNSQDLVPVEPVKPPS